LREQVRDVVRPAQLQRDDVVDLQRVAVAAGLHSVLTLDRELHRIRDLADRARAEPRRTDHGFRQLAVDRTRRAAAIRIRAERAACTLRATGKQDRRSNRNRWTRRWLRCRPSSWGRSTAAATQPDGDTTMVGTGSLVLRKAEGAVP